MKKRISLMVLDDHDVVRVGLEASLKQYPEFEIIGSFALSAQLLSVFRTRLPDVLLMDFTLGSDEVDGLNLRHAGVTDGQVHAIAAFTNLRQLRLEENAVTDASAKDISTLKDMTYLNLTNTKVTDAGFDAVSALPKLHRFYIWGTVITPAAVDKVKAARKDMILYAGLTPKDVPKETKIVQPTN
jgi:CheY-like chemotaxis protein